MNLINADSELIYPNPGQQLQVVGSSFGWLVGPYKVQTQRWAKTASCSHLRVCASDEEL
jgi:hypothetical protein